MRYLLVVAALLAAGPAAAQIQSRPTDAPLVTAAGESWYVRGEAVQFAGDVYYRAGAPVFFDGQTMVRTGHYNGVPLYANTTYEPFSVVFVPISRGLLQPYERRRLGDLVGTTGSRTPSFPVGTVGEDRGIGQAAAAPTGLPLPIGAISAYTAALPRRAPAERRGAIDAGGGAPAGLVSIRSPENNDGVWIRYQGEQWISDGPARRLGSAAFTQVGEYAGFPVFALEGDRAVIYLPSRDRFLAPYRVKAANLPTP